MSAATEPTPDFILREAVAADQPVILSMLQALQAYEATLHPGRKLWSMAETETYYSYLQEEMLYQGTTRIAEAMGKAVGFAMGWVVKRDADMQLRDEERRYGMIGEVYVAQDWRRRGVHAALQASLEDFFKAQQCRVYRCTTLGTNILMQASLKAKGYQPYEITFEKRL